MEIMLRDICKISLTELLILMGKVSHSSKWKRKKLKQMKNNEASFDSRKNNKMYKKENITFPD